MIVLKEAKGNFIYDGDNLNPRNFTSNPKLIFINALQPYDEIRRGISGRYVWIYYDGDTTQPEPKGAYESALAAAKTIGEKFYKKKLGYKTYEIYDKYWDNDWLIRVMVKDSALGEQYTQEDAQIAGTLGALPANTKGVLSLTPSLGKNKDTVSKAIKEDVSSNLFKLPKGTPSLLRQFALQQGVYWTNGKGGFLNNGLGIMNNGLGILVKFNRTLEGNIVGKMNFPKNGKILASELNRLSKYFVEPMRKLGSSFVCVSEKSVVEKKKEDFATVLYDLRAASTLTDEDGNQILIRCIYRIEEYID